jgi:hypothetical protein
LFLVKALVVPTTRAKRCPVIDTVTVRIIEIIQIQATWIVERYPTVENELHVILRFLTAFLFRSSNTRRSNDANAGISTKMQAHDITSGTVFCSHDAKANSNRLSVTDRISP